MGVMDRIKSNVLDVAAKGAQIKDRGANIWLRKNQYNVQNSIAQQNVNLRSKLLDATMMKTEGKQSKNVLDQAIRVHNKKLEVISKQNKDSAQYGGAQQPLPKFSDTLREDFGIESAPSERVESLAPAMAPQASQALGMARGIAASNIPRANQGPMIDENLKKILAGIPNPKKVINPRLPKLEDVIGALDDYDNPKDAIAEMLLLAQQYNSIGLDIAQVEEDDKFQSAFRSKFGDAALQELLEQLGSQRGGE